MEMWKIFQIRVECLRGEDVLDVEYGYWNAP